MVRFLGRRIVKSEPIKFLKAPWWVPPLPTFRGAPQWPIIELSSRRGVTVSCRRGATRGLSPLLFRVFRPSSSTIGWRRWGRWPSPVFVTCFLISGPRPRPIFSVRGRWLTRKTLVAAQIKKNIGVKFSGQRLPVRRLVVRFMIPITRRWRPRVTLTRRTTGPVIYFSRDCRWWRPSSLLIKGLILFSVRRFPFAGRCQHLNLQTLTSRLW